ncbi:MAG: metal-dependent hydrolase [Candidatus Pacearchaeota archaeon]|nr:metal-dependent hydrolase [Candidatus Pacearchaeota archaeon]
MLIKTHLVVALFFVLQLMGYFDNKILFFSVVFVSTFLPDVDSRFSKLGRKRVFRVLQFFSGHRKIIHSFVFLFLISVPIFYLSRVIFYGFVLGYGLHLLMDCFTVQGIKPFYPFEFKVSGFVRTGGFFEMILFYGFLFFNVMFLS